MVAFVLPEETNLSWYAVGIGLLYDLYYTGMIGMYLFVLPLIIYIVRYLKQYIPDSPFFIGFSRRYLFNVVGGLNLYYESAR